MTILAGLCGALVVGGLWFAITGLIPVPIVEKPHRQPHTRDPRLNRRVATAAALAIGAFAFTRWPVAAVAGAAAGWVLAGIRSQKEREHIERRTEAIALWTEMLRDAIGTARGIEGVLVATAATAPLPIKPALTTMAERLQHEPLDRVLDGLANDLDHPLGDLVVTALRLTSTSGGRQVRDVLSSLATAAYAEAESQRRIGVAREKPRAAMKYSAFIICGFVVLLTIFSRRYLEPYSSPIGQIVLLFVALYWTAGFWWMNRMGRIAPVERYLQVVTVAEPVDAVR
jgi:Flp pilus assembly protein TadB